MPIPFTCPHCHKRVKAPDQLAGQSGLCPGCKKAITIPKPSAALFDKPPAHEDVEAAAAAALADEPKKEELVQAKTIDFACPFCDEQLHLSVELAGKRSPCPECRRIIKVPELVKTEPVDWRRIDARGPSGARKPEEPAPEGAWGTATSARAVSKQALVEAEVLPPQRVPWTRRQKIGRGLLAVAGLAVIAAGVLGFQSWRTSSREKAAIKLVLEFVGGEGKSKTSREGVASLHGSLATYYLRTAGGDAAKEARDQFQKALSAVGQPAGNEADSERDAVLADLAVAEAELGGPEADVTKGQKQKWSDVTKLMGATLRAMRAGEARREGLRQVTRRLIDRGAAEQALSLAAQAGSGGDDPSGEAAELAGLVGLEMYQANQQTLAQRALKQAVPSPQEAAGVQGSKPSVVALALVLGQPDAAAGKGDEEDVAIGQALGLALKGQWDAARKAAGTPASGGGRFRALIALASVAPAGESTDAEAALRLAEGELRGRRELAWDMLRLTNLALQAGMDPQKLEGLTAAIIDLPLRGRAQLAILKSRLTQTRGLADESLTNAVEEKSLSRSLAREMLARHNARQDRSTIKTVADWPEPLNVFGSMGAALGLQKE